MSTETVRLRIRFVDESQGIVGKQFCCAEDIVAVFDPLRKQKGDLVTIIALDESGMCKNWRTMPDPEGLSKQDMVKAMEAAIVAGAETMVVMHCRPGEVFASEEDMKKTDALLKAGARVGLGVMDYITVSTDHDGYTSIKECVDSNPQYAEPKERRETRRAWSLE